jgi:hypothetical protein
VLLVVLAPAGFPQLVERPWRCFLDAHVDLGQTQDTSLQPTHVEKVPNEAREPVQ